MTSRLMRDVESILEKSRQNNEKVASDQKNALGEDAECATLTTGAQLQKIAAELRRGEYAVTLGDVATLMERVNQ